MWWIPNESSAIFITAPDSGHGASRLWQGCHSSADAAAEAGVHHRASPKSVGAREQVSFTPIRSSLPVVPKPGVTLRRSLRAAVWNHLLWLPVMAAHVTLLAYGLVYLHHRIFSFQVSEKGFEMSLHLSPIFGRFCTLFLRWREKLFYFLHRTSDALRNVLVADPFFQADRFKIHPIHAVHPQPAVLGF